MYSCIYIRTHNTKEAVPRLGLYFSPPRMHISTNACKCTRVPHTGAATQLSLSLSLSLSRSPSSSLPRPYTYVSMHVCMRIFTYEFLIQEQLCSAWAPSSHKRVYHISRTRVPHTGAATQRLSFSICEDGKPLHACSTISPKPASACIKYVCMYVCMYVC